MGWERGIMQATVDAMLEDFKDRKGKSVQELEADDSVELNVVNVGFGLGIVRDASAFVSPRELTDIQRSDRLVPARVPPDNAPHHRAAPGRARPRAQIGRAHV